MYVNSVHLENYRNYELLDLALGKQTTVLIGKNGAGKTNLISGLKQALSFIFHAEKGNHQYQFLQSLDQKVKKFEDLDPRWGDNGSGFDYCYPIIVGANLELNDGKHLSPKLAKWKKSDKKLDDNGFAYDAELFWDSYPERKDLPVFAFFSDSYPHVKSTLTPSKLALVKSGNPAPRNDGYYKWDEYTNCINLWMTYFSTNYKNSLLGSDKGDWEYVNQVCDCLMSFSQPLSDGYENKDITLDKIGLESRGDDYVIVFKFADGHTTPFDMLPMGLRRVFSIVFDLANRSYILNRSVDPEGVVFIDEVDLHLHPSLAQEILDRLRRTFPKIQFIVSTHSPLVLSNFKQDDNNIVYQLLKDDNLRTLYHRLPNSYGIDYNSLLEDLMESPVRNSMLQELINAYTYWKDAGDEVRMKRVIAIIESQVGAGSKLVEDLQK